MNYVLKLSIASVISTVSISSGYLSIQAIALESKQEDPSIIYQHPAFPPSHGRPGGMGTGAGDFSGEENACRSQVSNLVALVPEFERGEAWGLTTLPYPSFLIVIPDLPDDIQDAEFVLEDTTRRGTDRDVYRTEVDLPNQPGIIRIDLPEAEAYQLAVDRKYRWTFKISCSSDEDNPSPIFVSGDIIRTQLGDYEDYQLWYDLLQDYAELVIQENSRTNWQRLLDTVNLDNVADGEFLPCCMTEIESVP